MRRSALRRPPALTQWLISSRRPHSSLPSTPNPSLSTNSTNTNTTTNTTTKPLTSILIANRGEIALRVHRTASAHGIRTTTLYTDPDARSQHAARSPFSVNLGPPTAYLDGDRIIQVAREHRCHAVHPGYGFLSENAGFARKCADAGLLFIGPPPDAIEAMGSKSRSKEIMAAAGVPCIPGYHGSEQDPAYLRERAAEIGYPVLLKAVKGGGGKGMRIVEAEEDFAAQLESAKVEAVNSFGDQVMLVEKYITTPRHIEVQVFADGHGNVVALGERDCSIQRRHQKILEESPAPYLEERIRQDLWAKAREAARAVGYQGAGTVEFIFDNETNEFFFMEMNTRLQVEHPVTEMVTGVDLVEWQFIVAAGGKLPLTQEEIEERIKGRGHAIEARIYAENPDMNFIPSSGYLLHAQIPKATSTVRIDAGFVEGDEVSSHYDPMIAKLIVQGASRREALQKMRMALEEYEVAGPITNIEFLKRCVVSPDFADGKVETGYIQKHHDELFHKEPLPAEVLAQAAIGVVLQKDAQEQLPFSSFTSTGLGFAPKFHPRSISLVEIPADGTAPADPVSVQIQQITPETFDVIIGDTHYSNVSSTWSPSTKTLTSFLPHTRLATRFIRSTENEITLFQRGRQYRLQLATPGWAAKALGVKDVANSVLAPMPCKVLKVHVSAGDEVKKGQPMVVIESMKMETVIRSPGEGKVKRIVHGEGDIVKAGTALVEFEDDGEK